MTRSDTPSWVPSRTLISAVEDTTIANGTFQASPPSFTTITIHHSLSPIVTATQGRHPFHNRLRWSREKIFYQNYDFSIGLRSDDQADKAYVSSGVQTRLSSLLRFYLWVGKKMFLDYFFLVKIWKSAVLGGRFEKICI
jgi:hypothetical protein